jgi:hypothetical protein
MISCFSQVRRIRVALIKRSLPLSPRNSMTKHRPGELGALDRGSNVLPDRVGQRCEPVVFRARRAHTRSRGPQREVATARHGEPCHGRGVMTVKFERRAAERQSGFPAPPATRNPPKHLALRSGPVHAPEHVVAERRRPLLTLFRCARGPRRRHRTRAESASPEVLRQGGTTGLGAWCQRPDRDCQPGGNGRDRKPVRYATFGRPRRPVTTGKAVPRSACPARRR